MAEIVLPTEMLIDGQFLRGEGDVEKVLNPATGEVLALVPEASPDQIHKAVSAANRAFDAWSDADGNGWLNLEDYLNAQAQRAAVTTQ